MDTETIPKTNRVISYVGLKTVLRPVNPEQDLENVTRWINDETINQFLTVISPLTIDQERNFLKSSTQNPSIVLYAIEDKFTGQHIGNMSLNIINWIDRTAMTGSIIGEKTHWGKGYGTDAKKLLLNHAFNRLNLRLIQSSVIEFNDRSAVCLEKCGYKYEFTRKEVYYRDGKYWDQKLYRIFREEFDPIWKQYQIDLQNESDVGHICDRSCDGQDCPGIGVS